MLVLTLLILAQGPQVISPPHQQRPTPAQLQAMESTLRAAGLPPGLESWVDDPSEVHEVTLAPVFHRPFACSEHPAGQLHSAGDALGTDCMVVGGLKGKRGFGRMYRGNGGQNRDWYGWREEVHAPFDGVVRYLHVNPVTNKPGEVGKPPASMIEFERADGLEVVFAHIAEPRVAAGDHVRAGDVVAVVGNNGVARNPHIHIGAYRASEPLQIRWDLVAMGRIPEPRGSDVRLPSAPTQRTAPSNVGDRPEHRRAVCEARLPMT